MAESQTVTEQSAPADALPASSPASGTVPAAKESSEWRQREVGTALRIAFKLGTSLLMTWGIGLLVRFYLPRYLGPDRFGMLSFADAFTGAAFVVLSLGVETYVRKEIALRPEHAKDFIGGIVLLRLAMLVVVYGGMALVLHLTGRSPEVRGLVYIYGLAQFFTVGNATSQGLLQATGNVNELSVLTVVAKLLWAAGLIVAVFFDLPLWAFASALTLSEGLKSLVLFRLVQKKFDIVARFDGRAIWHVVLASLPFYVAGMATTIFNRVDVSILAVMSTDREVGWYGGAAGLASLTMLMSPLIHWVLVPLFSKAAAASEDELRSLLCRSLEFILSLAIPVSLMLVLGSDLLVGLVLGPKFAPAATAMEILSCAHVLMYLSLVCSTALTMLNRAWHATAVFGVGLIVSPLCNLLFVPIGLAQLGPGGGGAACAVATFTTELFVSSLLFWMLGRRGFDRRLAVVVLKSLAAAACALILDRWLFPHLGFLRLFIGGAVYAALAVATGAVDPREVLARVRDAFAAKRARAAA